METVEKYTPVAVAVHWIMAVGLLVNVVIILTYPWWGEEHIRFAIDTHKSTGILLLGFFIMRLLWRIVVASPVIPYSQMSLEYWLAKATHFLFYVLMLMLPLSGWLHDSAWEAAPRIKMYFFGMFEWPRIGLIMNQDDEFKLFLHGLFGAIHTWLSYFLYGLVLLHVTAAFKHHFSRSPVMGFKRMWF